MAGATGLYFLRHEYYAALACAVAIGWSVAAAHQPDEIPDYCQKDDVTYQAVAEQGYDTDGGFRIKGTLTGVLSQKDSCLYRVNPISLQLDVPAANLSIDYGDTIYFKGEFVPYRSNPDMPDEFNPGRNRSQYIAQYRVNPGNLTVAGNAKGLKWKLNKLRDNLGETIISSGLSEGCTNFLLAALLGEGQWISRDERDLYSKTGMAHILALSGAHVAIILSLLLIALFPLSIASLHRTRSVIIIILLWCYVVMTGGSPSVTRAVIMTTMLLGGRLLRRPYSGMNALCMAAILILIFTPNAIFQPGFQLSFMAVASISLLSEPLNPFKKGRFYKPSLWIVTPLAATLGTFALVLYHFHIFPVYFILIAPVATLLLTWVLIGGVLLMICVLTGLPNTFLTESVDFIFGLAHRYLGIAETLSESYVSNVYTTAFTAIVLTALPFALAAFIHYRKRWIAIATLGVIGLTLLVQFMFKPHYTENEIFILDNPYNISIVVKSNNNLYLISNADEVQSPLLLEEFKQSHKDYIGKRDIAEVTLVSESFNSPSVSRNGRLVRANGLHFILLDNKNLVYESPYPVDYLIVGEGFRGDIIEAVKIFNPDHVIIARNLNPRLRFRYINELKEARNEPIDIKSDGTLRITD